MLTIELPTRTRDYVIAIRDMPREDALTLSYLATRLGSDMLGTRAARRVERRARIMKLLGRLRSGCASLHREQSGLA